MWRRSVHARDAAFAANNKRPAMRAICFGACKVSKHGSDLQTCPRYAAHAPTHAMPLPAPPHPGSDAGRWCRRYLPAWRPSRWTARTRSIAPRRARLRRGSRESDGYCCSPPRARSRRWIPATSYGHWPRTGTARPWFRRPVPWLRPATARLPRCPNRYRVNLLAALESGSRRHWVGPVFRRGQLGRSRRAQQALESRAVSMILGRAHGRVPQTLAQRL